MGWTTTRDAVLAEIDGLVATVDALTPDQWAAPSACPGWTAGDAAAHVAGSIRAQHRAFQNMLAGSQETPEWVEPTYVDADTTRSTLAASQAVAVETMGRLTDEHADQPVPLPIGTFPLPTALEIILLEYGVHHWDVAGAVDPTATLSPPAAACVLGLMPAFMAFFAADPPPAAPLAYRLEGSSTTIHASSPGGPWVLEPAASGDTTVIRGGDAALALFALGRIGAGDPRLDVSGDHAAEFKAWFPGP